jgi:hypothetical protein
MVTRLLISFGGFRDRLHMQHRMNRLRRSEQSRVTGLHEPGQARRVLAISFRKEVIQPQVPLRLPCYDLVPIAEFILGAWLPNPERLRLPQRLRMPPTFVA